jgi:hypothetical protein
LRLSLCAELTIEPLGIRTLNAASEGILLITPQGRDNVWAWHYRNSVQTDARNSFTSIRTSLLGNYHLSLTRNQFDVKRECQERAGLKRAAITAWMVHAPAFLPVHHTIKPLSLMLLFEQMQQL